jgi:hypothetical protein
MPNSPLGNLPLADLPYNSRITSEYGSENKNYYMLAFNPGYALQASELNEMQELFYMNQNLTVRMNKNWNIAGLQSPYWEGLIPLNPRGLTSSTPATVTNQATVSVTIQPGWFLWTDRSSKLSFWIYMNQTYTKQFTTTNSATQIIGFDVNKATIICCPSAACSDTQDATLRDNSTGNSDTTLSCGASRLKAGLSGAPDIRTEPTGGFTTTFYPLLKLTYNGTNNASLRFYDDQLIATS